MIRQNLSETLYRKSPTLQENQLLIQISISTIFATTITTTSLVDAVPITSTTDLPSLPTGSYRINLNNLSSSTNDCLKTEGQESAWGCNTETVMDVLVNFSDPGQVQLSFSYDDTESSESSKTRYGPQPPGFSGLVALTPMMDKEDWLKGPAYVFHLEFDKVVILHENALNTTMTKRWLDYEQHEDDSFLYRRLDNDNTYIDDDDKPWYCFWNGTVLEGFIFVTEDLAGSTTETPISSNYSSVSSDGNEAAASTMVETADSLVPTFMIDPSSVPSPPAATSGPWKKRQETTPAPVGITSSGLIKYPKEIKIEERRNFQNSVQPYCQQMGLSEDKIVVKLDEVEKSPASMTGSSYNRRRGWSGIFSIFKRSTDEWSSSCGCEWIST